MKYEISANRLIGGNDIDLEPSPNSQGAGISRLINITWDKPFLKIGHGGAAGHAPANTLHSLQLALEMGVDIVEFDVRPCRDELVLIHDDSLAKFHHPEAKVNQSTFAQLRSLADDPAQRVATLAEGLDLIKGRALINIDLKASGYETAVLESVKSRGLMADVIYSSVIPSSLRRLRQAEPDARLGLSYPEDRGDASTKPYLQPVVSTVVAIMRYMLPYRVLQMMRNASADAVMLYHKVLTRGVIETVQHAGGKVFTWTVDEAQRMLALRKLGVNGIASNYPDLFPS